MEVKRRGRPPTGAKPKRNVRIGNVWDQAAELAAARGESMTDLVTRLLAAHVHRAEAATRRQS